MVTRKNPFSIVLIHPFTTVPPFGIMSIAAVLEREGFSVKILDYQIHSLSEKQLLRDTQGADMIGIATYTMPMISEAVHITNILKRRSKAFLFWGGVHATLFPKKSLNEFGLGCVVVKEGEFTVLELAQAIKEGKSIEGIKGIYIRKGRQTIFTGDRAPILDLEVLPPYAWHLIDVTKYIYVNLVTRRTSILLIESRGCPYDCTFCYVNQMFGRRWRGRTPRQVVDEMVWLHERFGMQHFDFLDDLPFGGSKPEMLSFCSIVSPHGFTWTCDHRVNCVDEAVLREMQKAGCRYIYYGVESGSPKMLKYIRKGITPEMVIKAFDATEKAGINCMAGFIGGFPDETIEDLKATVALARRIPATKFRLAKYVPYPGGELYEISVRRGFRPPEKTIEFSVLGDYKAGNLNLSKIPDKDFFKAKRIIERRTITNSVRFAFRHREFIFLPYFILDTMDPKFREPLISILKVVTAPIRWILKKKWKSPSEKTMKI